MSMGGAAPLIDYPKFYWAVVGSAIGVATLVNVFNHVLYRQRLSAAKTGSLQPAKPKTWPLVAIATTFAITRELSNYSIRVPLKNRILRLPTLGRSSLILANVVVLVVLGLYGLDLNDMFERENVGYRLGFVSIAQLPLIFLLAGKNNIIGYLTGVSYERLNWLHRWCARCLLLTATLHMGYFFSAWAPYDYIGVQLKENTLVWKGLVAWVMLVWIVFSSFAPIRGWCYEFFVIQHLVSFAVMIGFIYIHTPEEVHIYVWLPVGIFFLDRVLRTVRLIYANLSLFHPKQRRDGQSGLLTCKAEFTPLPHNTTRVVIHNPPINWTPGQHVFLSCQSIVPLQSHPFTIASVPADGRMEFLIKAETGGTRRFFKHAEKTHGLPATADRPCVKTVAIEGAYGCLRPLRQFDSVVLLAGSTGATFVVPLLRDIVQGWKENVTPTQNPSSRFQAPTGAVTRHVRFVWVVKSRGQLGWFAEQLSSVYNDFQKLQEQARHIKLELTIYVTCDESFTEEHRTLLSAITAPNPDATTATQQSLELRHGSVKYRSPSLPDDEKAKMTESYQEDIKEVRSNSTTKPCGCKTTIDESSPDAIQSACCCNEPTTTVIKDSPPQSISRISSTPSSSTHQQHPKPLVHPSISIFAGRPKPRDIIRRSLEQALGESAVVVCGPYGMVADVKHHVCSLSDERAVHKGTGAQGIYLHTESFGW
ncbi:hypothetical protein DM02DRAFT_532115 [Periconia macrospinosa]|uniref:ferric-chelate reductase (NADPH) n=1 Tax=Periconia macrospinosa TaxID=97972 RepID=A0A2V1DID0_9PLEO|nr:hypothetical protein DM02DRAFT_532115 [Periconia macrospinosa]